jgi:hypothetical protein
MKESFGIGANDGLEQHRQRDRQQEYTSRQKSSLRPHDRYLSPVTEKFRKPVSPKKPEKPS